MLIFLSQTVFKLLQHTVYKTHFFPDILTIKLLYTCIYEMKYCTKCLLNTQHCPSLSTFLFLPASSLNGLFEQRTFPLVVGRRHCGLFYTYFGTSSLRRCRGTLCICAGMKTSYRYCDILESESERKVMEDFHNENRLQVCCVLQVTDFGADANFGNCAGMNI